MPLRPGTGQIAWPTALTAERIQVHGKITGAVTCCYTRKVPTTLYWLAFGADDRACRHPGVKALLRRGDGELIAVPGQHSGLPRQRQHLLADRAELPGEVGEVVVVRDRAGRGQHVADEHGPEVLAVQADRAGRVTGGMHHLKRHVGDLEDAALLHLDVGVIVRMRLAPVDAVLGVHGHRDLVPGRHLHRGGPVARLPVHADHRDHLAVAHGGEHRFRLAARGDGHALLLAPAAPRVD